MEILDKQELASFLKVDIKTVNYLLYNKKIPKIRIGRTYRFVKQEIEDWVKAHQERPKKYNFSQITR